MYMFGYRILSEQRILFNGGINHGKSQENHRITRRISSNAGYCDNPHRKQLCSNHPHRSICLYHSWRIMQRLCKDHLLFSILEFSDLQLLICRKELREDQEVSLHKSSCYHWRYMVSHQRRLGTLLRSDLVIIPKNSTPANNWFLSVISVLWYVHGTLLNEHGII